MNNTQNYLFLFTISPVQSFIVQSRKTQDLYASSRLLSAMVQAGIGDNTEAVIYPVLPKEAKSAPNRFVLKLEIAEAELADFATAVNSRVRECLQEQSKKALKKAGVGDDKPLGFDQQLELYFSFFWTAVPFDEANYANCYQHLEQQIGRVKNVRPFQQFDYAGAGETGRKCSIEPTLNALFYRPSENSEGKPVKPNYLSKQAVKTDSELLDHGECLSAIGLLKRFADWSDKDSFPSTAEVALLHELRQLDDGQLQALHGLKQCFNKQQVYKALVELVASNEIKGLDWKNPDTKEGWIEHFDYQACFMENLRPKVFTNPFQLHLVKKFHDQLKSTLKTRYYALVQFDGDQMGKQLETISSKGSVQHKDFSARLASFAEKARGLVDEKQYGRTVYAGGDDFLGFINLEYLFEALDELRNLFSKEVGGFLSLHTVSDASQQQSPLSFSAGILIAHYKIPLHEVLAKTRQLEKKAKSVTYGGRNAFCISTIKHSGEIQEATFKWGKNNVNWRALQAVVEAVKPKEADEVASFSPNFIQQISQLLEQLNGKKGDFRDSKLVLSELKRLVNRSKKQGIEEKEVTELLKALNTLWKAGFDTHNLNHQATNFLHALHIADFLSRKTRN